MEERREENRKMLASFEELLKTVQAIKGSQSVIKQYLELQFGSADLVGKPIEGLITRDLREINEKVRVENVRVTNNEKRITLLENWRWYALGIIVGIITVLKFLFK